MPMSQLFKFCRILLLIFMFTSLSCNAQDTITLPEINCENNTLNNSSQPTITFTFHYGDNDYEYGGWYDRKAYQEWYNEHKKNKRK